MKKILCFILCIAVVLPILTGCGSFFAEAEVKIEDIVPKTLDDGRTQITIMYTDPRIPDEVFYIAKGEPGEEGDEGVGIFDIVDVHVDAKKDEDGNILKEAHTLVTVLYTDDREPSVFEIPDGIYVVDADPDAVNAITGQSCVRFTYSDGTSYDLEIPKGDKGDKGDPGVGIDTENSGMVEEGNNIKITLTFTDGSEPKEIVFPKGVNITDIKVELGPSEQDERLTDYYLVITYSNGETTRVGFAAASQWYSGQLAPSAGTPGREGDYFLAEEKKTIYRMENGQWMEKVILGDETPTVIVTFNLNNDGDNAPTSLNSPNNTFSFKRGECFASNNYYKGNIPIPTRDGYTFVGWYTKAGDIDLRVNSAFTDLTAISSDITLYAKWEKIGE